MAAIIGITSYAQDHRQVFTDRETFLDTIREELPYFTSTGFRFLVTSAADPETKMAADGLLYDLYGEPNPHDLAFYADPANLESTPVTTLAGCVVALQDALAVMDADLVADAALDYFETDQDFFTACEKAHTENAGI